MFLLIAVTLNNIAQILIFHECPIHIAPYPSFSGLCRSNNGMARAVKMFGHMLVRRRITTKRCPASLAGTQMHPLGACFDTFFTNKLSGLL
jgi:hypothetical protein